MITGLPELNRYLDDAQWSMIAKSIRAAGGKTTDGNRLHVDACIEVMKGFKSWRDLDYRYGPWSSVHSKFVRWYETGILHGIVQALFQLGLTEDWKESYHEVTRGPTAVGGPPIRQIMATIVRELRRSRAAKGKAAKKAVLPAPKGDTYRQKAREYAQRVKEAVKARRKEKKTGLCDADWAMICDRIKEFDARPQGTERRQIDELIEVMRTNKGWNYMDPKAGTAAAVYAKFVRWMTDGTMRRLVKCLTELGLTADWNSFLVVPCDGEPRSLKAAIGSEAAACMGRRSTKKKAKAVPRKSNGPSARTSAKKASTTKVASQKTTAKTRGRVSSTSKGGRSVTKTKSASARKPRASSSKSKAKQTKTNRTRRVAA